MEVRAREGGHSARSATERRFQSLTAIEISIADYLEMTGAITASR